MTFEFCVWVAGGENSMRKIIDMFPEFECIEEVEEVQQEQREFEKKARLAYEDVKVFFFVALNIP